MSTRLHDFRPPHAMAVYESDDDLARRVLPYVRDGVERDETVVVLASDRAADVLRSGLGDSAPAVRWDVAEADYRHLGRTFEMLRSLLASAERPVRLVAEGDVEADGSRIEAYLRFEAATNDVYAEYGMPWLCLYDRARYPVELIERVERVHPHVVMPDATVGHSGAYVGPDAYLGEHPGPLSPAPATAALDDRITWLGALAELRRRIARLARQRGMALPGRRDVQLAVTEIVTNALQHGSAPCRVRAWRARGSLVVRVDDQGTGGVLPTEGFRPPAPEPGESTTRGGCGAGLWITRQLADVVHVEVRPDGATVEMHFPLR